MRHERRNRIDGYRARARRGVHAGPSASKSRVVVRRSTHVRPRSPPAPAPSPASARHRRRPRRPRRCPSYRRQRLWVATRRHPRARSPPRQTWPEERPSCELASREASFPMYPLATARHLSVRRRAWRRARQLCTPRRRRGDVSLGLVRDGRPRNGGRGPHFQTSYPYRSRFSETLQVTSAHFRDENEKFFPGRLTTPRVACRCSPAPRASARSIVLDVVAANIGTHPTVAVVNKPGARRDPRVIARRRCDLARCARSRRLARANCIVSRRARGGRVARIATRRGWVA